MKITHAGQQVEINPYLDRIWTGTVIVLQGDCAVVDVPGFKKFERGCFVTKTHRFMVDLDCGILPGQDLLGETLGGS